ncbi:hypothetical protein [Marivirga sp.]|uniref:hypothetical protein n=1 Tax=Marivirga sp. TaxID=2018662 RepID=UPI0025DED67E|nr:hypothetical protein [Marivirga sp.]
MKTIEFNPNGEALKVSFKFSGFLLASYTYTLWEAESNHKVVYEKGNNQNPQDDTYQLPMPLKANDGRLIQLRTEFIAQDPSNVKNYTISAEVYQGSNLLGSAKDEGGNTGSAQSSLIFIKMETL